MIEIKQFNNEISTSDNKGFKKLAFQWLNKLGFSNESFVVAANWCFDPEASGRQLLKPANR